MPLVVLFKLYTNQIPDLSYLDDWILNAFQFIKHFFDALFGLDFVRLATLINNSILQPFKAVFPVTADLFFYEIIVPLLMNLPPDLFLSWFLYHSSTKAQGYEFAMRLDAELAAGLRVNLQHGGACRTQIAHKAQIVRVGA